MINDFIRILIYDDAFSIGLSLSLLKPLNRFVGLARPATYTERVVRWGLCRPPLRYLSHFLSYQKEKDQLLMVL